MRLTGLIHAVEAHAEGEPARVVVGGVVDVPGASMFEKKLYLERERDSLPVASYVRTLSQPITPGPTTPALVHSTPFLSKFKWCVGKQVRIRRHCCVFGSK